MDPLIGCFYKMHAMQISTHVNGKSSDWYIHAWAWQQGFPFASAEKPLLFWSFIDDW